VPCVEKWLRFPQLSDGAASYRCAYRARARALSFACDECGTRVFRVSGTEESRADSAVFRIAAKREAKTSDIYTGKLQRIVVVRHRAPSISPLQGPGLSVGLPTLILITNAFERSAFISV